MCGQCCANQDVIQLTSYELFQLAGHLQTPPAELCRRHCTIAGTSLNARKHLYIRTENGRCPFLEGRLCGVHPARPFACRAYPMRALECPAGDMKRFVRQRYPMLEQTCGLFAMGDADPLAGDIDLLVDQAIAYAVDEVCFNAIGAGAVDLAVPARVAAGFLADAGARAEAAASLRSAGKTPMARAVGRMAMALQAAAWGAPIAFVREPSRVTYARGSAGESPVDGERVPWAGGYVLAATDRASVEAVRAFAQSPGLNCKAFSESPGPGRALISAVYAAPDGHAALGFQLELEEASVREMTREGATPLYAFFVPEDGPGATQAAGLPLNLGRL